MKENEKIRMASEGMTFFVIFYCSEIKRKVDPTSDSKTDQVRSNKLK